MSLRKAILALLVVWFGVIGMLAGLVCLLCLTLVLLWQGLGVTTFVLAFVCLACLSLAVVLAGRVTRAGQALPAFAREKGDGTLNAGLD